MSQTRQYTVFRKKRRDGLWGKVKALPSTEGDVDRLKRKGFVVRQAQAERMSQAISEVMRVEGWGC